ncbi:MAG TPA: adenylate/guanylate cyclase domain-containing protein [Stellaceae bacterium]|nr:adenylate/guanylate cyclase domain-containing protein [Stellaceae bacterium]
MSEDRIDRRLAAILAADVAGYSRLMGADEEGTHRQLKAHRKELIDPKIAEHRGRIVKSTGDGILVEFVSVVDAVRCAVDIQRGMGERNAVVPQEGRIDLRIGINVGDIISDGGDIYGDGVNVAARLEALAEPGGIYVSRVVHDQVCDKLSFGFEDMGEQTVKNIARPVGVHRVRLSEHSIPQRAAGPSGQVEQPISDRPALAVLPFVNMSGDPEQEFFADGISEDIITGLSKLRWFFVIARNSSFSYKGKSIDVKRAARELGVRYVLEGSVRKGGNRVRITAQLIDAVTGNHVWADHYDGELSDIFGLQDEITKKVVAVIEPKLLEAEGLRSQSRSADDLGAWEMVIRANSLFWRLTKTEITSAIELLQRAVERYPNYAPAHSLLAFLMLVSGYVGSRLTEAQLKQADSLAARAAELDDSDPAAHVALGFAAFMRKQTNIAASEFHHALSLNPNFAAAHGYLGWTLAFDGQADLAKAHLEEAMRLSPHDPQNAIFNTGLAIVHYFAGRYADAVEYSRKALQQRTTFTAGYRIHVASLAQAGRIDEAREALARLKESLPELSVAWIEQNVPYAPGPMARFLEGMRKAGLQ